MPEEYAGGGMLCGPRCFQACWCLCHQLDKQCVESASRSFHFQQAGLAAKDLVPMIGNLNRVYEILNYKRPPTLAMIRRLHVGLHISAESLIGERP